MAEPSPTPKRIPVRLADGQVGTVAAADAAQALQAGATPLDSGEADYEANQAKYGGYGSQLAAAGLGAARGATLGLSDYAAAGLLGKDYVAGVQKANPIASTAGEVGGVILPSLLTAGEYTPIGLSGALARGAEGVAGRALGEGLLAKAGSMAIGGAIEGGAMGEGGAVSEAALGDEQLTAEKLLAGAGQGALAGGLLGGGLGLAGGVAGKALRGGGEALARIGSGTLGRIEGKTGAEIAGELSGKYAYAATGARKAEYDALAAMGKSPAELGNWLQDNWSKYSDKAWNTASAADRNAAVLAMKKEAGQAVGDAIRSLDKEAIAGARAELKPIAGVQNFINRAETDIVGKLQANPVFQSEAKRIQGLLTDFRVASGLDVAPEQLAGLKQIAASGGPDAAAAAAKLADVEAKQASMTWEKLHDWRRSLDSKTNFVAEGKAVNDAFKEMRRLAESEIEGAAKAAGGQVGEAYTGAKDAFGKASDLARATKQGVARTSSNRALGLSEQFGIIGGLMTGNPLAGLVGAGLQYGVKHYGDQIAASVLRKASTLESMQRAVMRTDALKDTAIKSFFSRQASSVGTKAGTAAGIARRIEAVQQDAATPPQMRNDPHAPDPLVAPKTSFAYQQARSQAVNWLATQIPQGSPKTPLIPTLRNPPSKAQLLSWNAKADVFEDPIGTIGHAMKTGTLRAEHVDALDAMYPKLAEDLRRSFQQALISVTSAKDLPSGNKLRQLGILLRTPATPDQDPQFVASQQAVYQQAAQENQAASAGPKPGGSGKPSNLSTGEDELE